MHSPTSTDPGERTPTRRLVLKATLTLPALSILGCNERSGNAAGATEAASANAAGASSATSTTAAPARLAFFSDAERAFVDAATARLIPDGDDGLGARAANVTVFIDSQLAGAYGRASGWYMQGPFANGAPEQGWQLALTPAQLYRAAIADIDSHCQAELGKIFAALAPTDQDRTLHALEKEQLALPHASAKAFFDTLLQNTQEGFLADPLYGGNRDFTGWRLVGFPGPRYNYVVEITQYGKRYPLPPVGLLGRDGRAVWS